MSHNHFFVFASLTGRIDTGMVRLWVDDAKVFELMIENPSLSIIRVTNNQIAALFPESDRVAWLDIKEADTSDIFLPKKPKSLQSFSQSTYEYNRDINKYPSKL